MQARRDAPYLAHPDKPIGQNGRVKKADIRQILARNLREAMNNSQTLDTQLALAGRAGISQSHLSEILRGITSVTVDLVNDLAYALGMEPWELLADSEETRQAALAKLMWGEKSAPPKEAARRRGKKSNGGDGGNRQSNG